MIYNSNIKKDKIKFKPQLVFDKELKDYIDENNIHLSEMLNDMLLNYKRTKPNVFNNYRKVTNKLTFKKIYDKIKNANDLKDLNYITNIIVKCDNDELRQELKILIDNKIEHFKY